jgi:hypothetical protein
VQVTVAGTTYSISPNETSWQQAQDACKGLGGDLASASSAELAVQLNDKVMAHFPSLYYYWLGGRYKDGSWYWVDGSAWSYTRWLPGEPSRYWPNEDCVAALGRPASDPLSAQWNDDGCDARRGFVCVTRGAALCVLWL